jgi:hypothetical protein
LAALLSSTAAPVVAATVPPDPSTRMPPPRRAVVRPRVVFAGSEAPSPVTSKLPVVLVSERPLGAPFAATLRKTCTPLVPESVTAVPLPVAMVLFAPATLTVPPPVALKPAPLVVLMARLPLPKLIVAPVLLLSVTAAFAPVLTVLAGLLKLIVPPLLA